MKTFKSWLNEAISRNLGLATANIFGRLQHVWDDHFGEFTKQAFMKEKTTGQTSLQEEFSNIETAIMQYLNSASMGNKSSQVIFEKTLEKLVHAIEPFDTHPTERINEFISDIFIGSTKFPKQFFDVNLQKKLSNTPLIMKWYNTLPRLNWQIIQMIEQDALKLQQQHQQQAQQTNPDIAKMVR